MDDKELEEAINLELSYIELTASEYEDFENSDQEENTYLSDDGAEPQASDEIPQSMLSYFDAFKNKTSVLEKLVLEDLEDMDSNQPYLKSINSAFSEDLRLLASELNEDPKKLKDRVLSDLEKEEDSLISTSSSTAAGADVPDSILHQNQEALEEDKYLDFEKQLEFELKALKDKQKEDEERQAIAYEEEREKNLMELKEMEEKKRCRQRDFEEKLRRMEDADKLILKDTQIRDNEISVKLQQEMVQQQELIRKLQIQMEEETRELERIQLEESMKKQEDRCCAALKIQAGLRGLLARRWTRAEIQRKRDEQRRCQEQQRKKREIEERCKREKEEEKRRKEQEVSDWEIRRAEYERAKEEERVRVARECKLEEERRKKEEEKRKKEEEKERRNVEEERKKKEVEEETRQIEEKRKKKEEEEERRHIEEERKKKKEGERRRQIEEEGRKKEAEKERGKKEEMEKIEEIRNSEEDDRKKEEMRNDKRKKDEEEEEEIRKERKTKEEEDKRKLEKVEMEEIREREIESEAKKTGEDKKRIELEKDIGQKEEERANSHLEGKEQVVRKTRIKEENSQINTDDEIIKREEEGEKGEEEKKYVGPKRDSKSEIESVSENMDQLVQEDPTNQRKATDRHDESIKSNYYPASFHPVASIPNPTPAQILDGRTTQTTNTDADDGQPFDNALQEDMLFLTSIPEPLNKEDRGVLFSHPSNTTSTTESGTMMFLPDQTEEKRLAWMRDCTPWSKLSMENRRKKVHSTQGRRGLKRGAESCRPLCPDRVLQSGTWNSLQEVNTVTLEDLPGCSVSTLAQCPRLQALTLRRCGLRALEGLAVCEELRYIDVQENEITFVNCENLSNLQVLRLGQNRLTAIHGLSAAVNLVVLELSHNSITRIGGLEGLKRLQTLLVDHNQCISTRGLREVCTLLHLDCSHNHLTTVEGLEDCVLLRSLDLRGNNLTEPPSLRNHVLLSELCLEDNNICSLEGLADCWLPLLQVLSGARNSITELPSLSGCVSLEKLDLGHNCLSEVQSVLASLVGCAVLQEVDFTGNPLQQDSIWSSSLLKAVPSLRALDGQPAHSGSPAPPAVTERVLPMGSFLGLCQAQLQQLRALQQRHSAELNAAPSSLAAVEASGRHHGEALSLAEEHRYAHEYGDDAVTVGQASPEHTRPAGNAQEQGPHLDPVVTVELRAVLSPRPPGSQGEGSTLARTQRKGSVVEELTRIPDVDLSVGDDSAGHVSAVSATPCSPEEKGLRDSAREPPSLNRESLHIKKMVSVGIQQHWQRQSGRMDMCTPQVDGGEGGGGVEGRGTTALGPSHIETSALDPSNAATAIQALWRGYSLRRRLAAALAAAASASSDAGEEEDSLEEVDVDEFVFDETDVDKEWMALLSEESSPPKSVSFSDLPLRPKSATFQPEFPAPQLCRPKQAWMAGQRAEPPSHGPSPESTSRIKSPTSASVIGGFSERSEKILQEWGFNDSHTALLMLKRAQKMKSTKQRQRKLLDPTVRLALFRAHSNQHPPVCPPRKPPPERREYIKAHDAELGPGGPGKAEQTWPNKERTHQWLHTQAMHSDRPAESDRFLPEIDPDILNGGRVQLVAVAGYREGADQASGSQTSGTSTSPPHKELWQSRRNSMGHPKKEVPSTKRVTSAPSKKERISFRDNPVHMSGGWGGGKKREKVCK